MAWAKHILVGLLVVALFVLLSQAPSAYEGWRVRGNAKAHLLAFTANDLQLVANALLHIYEVEKRDPLAIRSRNEVRGNGLELYRAMAPDFGFIRFTAEDRGWVRLGVICDSWKRPVRVVMHRIGSKVKVRLWSDGPNKRDDNRQGDDILREVEIRLP